MRINLPHFINPQVEEEIEDPTSFETNEPMGSQTGARLASSIERK